MASNFFHDEKKLLAILRHDGGANPGEGGATEHIPQMPVIRRYFVLPAVERLLRGLLEVERRHRPPSGHVLGHNLRTRETRVLSALVHGCPVPAMDMGETAAQIGRAS